jgi:serine/threonine-protein kinase RIM15
LDHLINEIGSLNALDDAQCILKLHGLIETRFYAVLVTDYIEGPNLLDYTHFQPGHKLCSYSAKQFIAQAYLALDAMHKRSLVHRDIKPDNMMVNGKG